MPTRHFAAAEGEAVARRVVLRRRQPENTEVRGSRLIGGDLNARHSRDHSDEITLVGDAEHLGEAQHVFLRLAVRRRCR